jgi:type 2 lantibiotic biosynthesis protein LanM
MRGRLRLDFHVAQSGRLGAVAPFDLAARASSAAEQIRIVEELGADAGRAAGVPLSRVDAWKLQRLACSLALDGIDAGPGAAGRSAEELERVLAAHRLLARRLGAHDPREREVLADVHAAWLPTYDAALRDFELAPPSGASGLEPDRRSRLALVCRPFCELLRRELADAALAANETCGRARVTPAVLEAFEEHLIDRFELAVAWAVEADQNVAFARLGIDRVSATADDQAGYFERTFADAAARHDFHLRFPVLGRWLATVTRQLCDNGARLVARLARDAGDIGAELFGEPIVAFESVSLGRSDVHAGGCSVAMVDARLASGLVSFVYKPRCLRSEQAMQGLLRRLGDDGVLGFALHRVLVKDGYGYEERIPTDRNRVASPEEAAQVYEELGGFLAMFYILGGSDLHYENVMVADAHVFICDCETALGTVLAAQEPATGTVLDSVYRTGLLEWPLPATEDVVLRLSACSGGESYEIPFALPRLQDGPALAVRYETGIHIDENAPNRIHLDGQVVEARDFETAILRGFGKVHDWFRDTEYASRCVSSLFAGTEVRLVARATQVYAQLLMGARHPRCLTEPLEVDVVFGRLLEAPHRWDAQGLAAAAEACSLWQLDVPTFASLADATELLHDHATPVAVDLERSPLQLALDRIAALSTEDRRRQVGYISASLSLAEVQSPAFVTTALDYAQLVGDELCTLLDDSQRPARWTAGASDPETDGVEGSLYYGSAGAALFLAYLDAIKPQERVRRAAEAALTHSLSCACEGMGAFEGLAGQIYVLVHLHALWGAPELLASAIERSRELETLIDSDRAFDVLGGSAGAIVVMLGLAGASGEGLDVAHRCARHLLRHAERAETGLSWAPRQRDDALANLTGLSHGAGGIGWALIAVGATTGCEEYVDAGRHAFAYERLHFDEDRRDWYDLRTSIVEMMGGGRHFANAWCNGASGIGLTRLASWVALGESDDALLDETYLALSATLRNFTTLGNDTLCHGRSGNAELLLRFARVRNEPAFQLEANMHAQASWRRLATTPEWPREEDGHQPLSGLMLGIAGVGLHYLRLAHPERVPSPLVLDPPQPAR